MYGYINQDLSQYGYHVSIGMASVSENYSSMEELLMEADHRMYIEKRNITRARARSLEKEKESLMENKLRF